MKGLSEEQVDGVSKLVTTLFGSGDGGRGWGLHLSGMYARAMHELSIEKGVLTITCDAQVDDGRMLPYWVRRYGEGNVALDQTAGRVTVRVRPDFNSLSMPDCDTPDVMRLTFEQPPGTKQGIRFWHTANYHANRLEWLREKFLNRTQCITKSALPAILQQGTWQVVVDNVADKVVRVTTGTRRITVVTETHTRELRARRMEIRVRYKDGREEEVELWKNGLVLKIRRVD